MEEILTFENNNKQKLYGIIHVPEANKLGKKILVVMNNSGLVDRVGPHRLYVKIARRLCSEGYYVFCFDSHGLGHSEGELTPGPNVVSFVQIENGLFVKDVSAAINYLVEKIVPDRIFLSGLCGGAVTSLLTAELDKRVNGLMLLDPPVYLDSAGVNYEINPLEVEIVFGSSLKKILDLKYWIKLFSFRINIFTLSKMFFVLVREKLNKKRGKDHKPENCGRPLNKKFVRAFSSLMTSKRKVLFVLGEKDFVATEFKYKFQNKYLTGKYKHLYEVINVENANHEFHSLTAQTTLMDKISSWLSAQNAK